MLLETVKKFPKWAKYALCLLGNAAGVTRVFAFVDDCIAKKEEKRTRLLAYGIVCLLFYPIGIVLGIVDVVSLAKTDEFSDFLR